MLLLLQNVLYCLLYVMLIKCAVKNDGLNCLYFYPKEYIEEAEKRGIANKETVMKKSKWFMIPFCVIIFVALILIISIWNHVTDFKTAYFQSFLFLVIMNWFDGIVIDRLWVGHSKIWHIEGIEEQFSSSGTIQNDIFGDYIRYTHASCHSYVVVNIDGKILVVNGENDAETKEIYQRISEKVSKERI